MISHINNSVQGSFKRGLCTLLLALTLTPLTSVYGSEDFENWIENFYLVAAKDGVTRQTWDQAFKDITEPDPVVLEKAAYQPEFTSKIWDYLDARVNTLSTEKGQKMDRFYSQTLESVADKFAVKRSILLAIWSMESNYGDILKRTDRLHYVPRALATLGYGDPKRRKFARTQLVAALKILQAGDVKKDQFMGSWAGAMGHTQFIPTSYLAYGVDMDGNGRRDIWNSIPDALATAANLLHKNGWRTGKTWGYEVLVPTSKRVYEGETKLLSEWQKLGVIRPGSKAFAWPNDKAVLKFFAGKSGPAFLVMKNFYVLKRYNSSDSYALAVGMLADKIDGFGGLSQQWPRPPGALLVDDKIELQRLLKEKGYYSATIDGNLGKGSREAIRTYQRDMGLEVSGEPTSELLQRLRQ
ncbi:MAG: membrane-bound lytic murein transglycosylase B [Desulforhopalus sp.]|jgi:membrane-bound lytic murein transglycosylase B